MKILCLVLLLSAVASARAENPPTLKILQTNQPASAPGTGQTTAGSPTDQKPTTQIELFAREMPLRVGGSAPNEIAHGRWEADGIFVELAITDNPLQLINPAAPERFGSAEDNLARDPVSGKASGLKFLELRF